MRAAKRRKSVVEDGKSNMKQRFAQLRRRSEHVNPTVKMLRSQSMVENLNTESDSDIGTGPRSAPFDGPSDADRPRRRRRPQTEIYETNPTESVNYNSDASVPSGRSETMAERMQRRRRSRVNSEEVQNNINNARQEGVITRQHSKMADEDGSDTQRSRSKLHQIEGSGYSSDNNRMNRRWRSHKNVEDTSRPTFQKQDPHDVDVTSPHSRRHGVVSREDSSCLSDVPGDENISRQRAYRSGQSDSMLSLTDVARYKLPGDRTPLVPASVANPHQYQNIAYKPRSRYGQQYVNGYEEEAGMATQQQRHSRSASPCGSGVSQVSVSSDYSPHDPGAPPRPALPVAYSNFRSRGQSDTDIMDTDQEKINYREAIRKMSSGRSNREHGPRRRSADMSGNMAPKNPDKPRSRTRDMSPLGRLR